MTGSLSQLRVAACVLPGMETATHGCGVWMVYGLLQGKDRTIVPTQLLRQRFTHFHQAQMFVLAAASAN